jgi:uncharacterized protein (TIGR02145 family)
MAKKEPFSFAVNGDYLTESTVYTWSATPPQYATIINQGNKVALIAFDDGSVESEFDAVVSVVAANECGSGETISTATIHLENDCRPVNQPEVAQNSLNAYAHYPFTLKATIPAGGNPNYTVQWYKMVEEDAIAINNSNNLSFNHTETETGSSYQYYCVVWPNCGTEKADGKESPHITVEVEMNPAMIPAASGGILRGKACFDIAATNAAGRTSFATLSDRQEKNKTDFSILAPVSYTFVANVSDVSGLRFIVMDTDKCVQEITGNLTPGTVLKGNTAIIQLKYKEDLNSETSTSNIVGRTRAKAAKVVIYAIYYDGAKDVALSLTADVMDDACCGVNTVTGLWKNFMCHNLGADYNSDPFTPNAATVGNYYQWGQKNPVYNPAKTRIGTFIASGTIANSAWTAARGPEDPCPFGWRVPSIAEFESVGKATTGRATITCLPNTSWTGNTFNKGIVFGRLLMFTGAGYRNYAEKDPGTWRDRDESIALADKIHYWSNTAASASSAYRWILNPNSNVLGTDDDKRYVRSVRCIADE